MTHLFAISMQFMKLGRALYIDWIYLHSCVPFSVFHNGFVSLSYGNISGPKNKCIIFTLFVFIVSRSVCTPIAISR